MEINTSQKNIKIWLAKIPSFLASRILECPNRCIIGEIGIIKATGSSDPILSFNISDELAGEGFPTEYTIRMAERDSNMFLIRSTDTSVSTEGTINKECIVMPVPNREYLNFKQVAVQPQKDISVIDYSRDIRGDKFDALRELEFSARKRKKMLQDKKRERLNKSEVMDIVFRAFEMYDAWTVKDLADFSGQPVAYIQEIVGEICNLNKRDHKNTYELKPEYRQ